MKLDSQLEELIVEWEVRRLDGVDANLSELCADCPDLLPRLQQAVQELRATEWMLNVPSDDDGGANDDSSSDGGEAKSSSASPQDFRDEFSGRTIGEYRILRQIGAGGMGVVYLARHIHLHRNVAVKMLSGFRTGSADSIARFQREIRAMGRLNHPNIVTAYDARQTDGNWFLVMEFIEGVDARCAMDTDSVSSADACEIVRQAALGLQHAHDYGLIHRDIKPSNMMISAGGVVRVLDLGLARITEEQTSRTTPATFERTSTGQVLGTIDYMAPEQMDDGARVDLRADIYGLGATLFRLLTGLSPIDVGEDATPLAKVRALSLGQFRSIEQLRPDLPHSLIGLVTRMLEPSPNNRRLTAADVAEQLEPFCADADLTGLVPTGQSERSTCQLHGVPTQGVPNTAAKQPEQPQVGGLGGEIRRGLILSGLAGLVLFAAAVFYIKTDYGTLEVHAGEGVSLETLKNAGVRIVHSDTDRTYELTTGPSTHKTGDYEIKVTQVPDQLQFSTREFSIARGQPTELIVRFKPRSPMNRADSVKPKPNLTESRLSGSAVGTAVTVDPPAALGLRFDQKPFEGRIWALKFSADGRRLYVSGVGDAVVVLNAATGEEVRRLTGFRDYSRGMDLTADGKTLYCGDAGGRILEFETSTGVLQRTVYEGTGSVREICLSPDGTQLAFTDDKAGLRVIDIGTGNVARQFGGNWYICPFWQDRSTLFSYGLSKNPSAIDLSTGDITSLREGSTATDGTFAAQVQNNVGVFVRNTGEVDVFNVLDGNLLRSIRTVPGRQLSVQMPAKRDLLAISGLTRHIQILNTSKGNLAASLTVSNTRGCRVLQFSPDESMLAAGTHEGRVLVFDLAADLERRKAVAINPPELATRRVILRGHRAPVLTVAFAPDLKTLYSTSDDGTVRVWSLESGQQTGTLVDDKAGSIRPLLLQDDGRTLLVGGRQQNTVRFIDVESGDTQKRVAGHDHPVDGMDVSSDGRWLVTSAHGGESVLLHDLVEGESHPLPVKDANDCRFVMDDRFILVVKWGRACQLIALESRQIVRTIAEKVSAWHHIGLNADRTIASFGSTTPFGYVWDLEANREVMSFRAEKHDAVTNSVLTPDGRTVITRLDHDRTRFLDVATGKTLGELDGVGSKDYTLNHYLSPDGSLLAVCGRDGLIRVYEIHWEQLARQR